jgi:hypothetical protein
MVCFDEPATGINVVGTAEFLYVTIRKLFDIIHLNFPGIIIFALFGDNEFGAGGEAVGVGEGIAVGVEDFWPLALGAIVLLGDLGKGLAFFNDVESGGGWLRNLGFYFNGGLGGYSYGGGSG